MKLLVDNLGVVCIVAFLLINNAQGHGARGLLEGGPMSTLYTRAKGVPSSGVYTRSGSNSSAHSLTVGGNSTYQTQAQSYICIGAGNLPVNCTEIDLGSANGTTGRHQLWLDTRVYLCCVSSSTLEVVYTVMPDICKPPTAQRWALDGL